MTLVQIILHHPLAPKIKSYYKYHIRGLQKCKNHQKIPTGSGCYGLSARNLAELKRYLTSPLMFVKLIL